MTAPASGAIAVLYVGDAEAGEIVDRVANGDVEVDVSVEPEPEAALERLDGVECVLSEHDPPEFDGVALLQRAREAGSHVPFLLVDGGGCLPLEEAVGVAVTDGGLDDDDLADEIDQMVDAAGSGEPTTPRPTADLHRLINQAIARARSREEIEQAVCERLAGSDAGQFVWIGGVDDQGVIVPRAAAGNDQGYLQEVRDRGDWSAMGDGPIGRAIRTRDLQYAGDIDTDRVFEPWREPALDRDFRSVVAIPLVFEDRIQGAVVIYADRVDAFDPDERELLSELGTTVAHALEAIDARDEAHRFQQTIEHAGHAIYIADHDGYIEYVNPAFEEITEYTREEAVGRRPDFLHVDGFDRERVDRVWETLTGGETWSEEIYERRASGEVYLAQQTIAPIGRDRMDGFVVVQNDITRRRLRGQRLSVMNRVLRHNLRNDANVILGGASNAIERSGDPAVESALDPAADAAQRLISMAERARHVDQVLEWVHSSDQHSDSLGDLVERVRRAAEGREPEATVLVELPEEEIVVDSSVELAIEELVDNAIEHAGEGAPRVEIDVERTDGDDVTVAISDDGPGIPQNERETLKQGYETQLTHGVGLGLWFVYWIVTSAGGVIDIADDEDGGSVVTLHLPVVGDDDE